MNVTTKRHIASWVLLAVYVPLLLISSLHIHETSDASEPMCAECVHHQCHGHLSQLSDGMHQCTLCQILTLTYIAATTGALLCYCPKQEAVCAHRCQAPSLPLIGCISLRGPPAVKS